MPRGPSDKTKLGRGWGVIDVSKPWLYNPWIRPQELFNGRGRRHFIPDLKYPERMICLLSDLEKNVYYLLRRDPVVIELFEQYPLQQEVTENLCKQFGIKHPKDYKTHKNKIMTTDFVAIIQGPVGEEVRAFAVKPKRFLSDERIKEKLFLEMKYWEQYNVPGCVITEEVFSYEDNKRKFS